MTVQSELLSEEERLKVEELIEQEEGGVHKFIGWWGKTLTFIAFMMTLFRQGAFQGGTPDEAFSVQCDRSTNPQENVDAGIVTAKVAFAPLKPAEFVVIEISQKSLLVA